GPWDARLTLGHAIAGTVYLPALPDLPDDLVASASIRSLEGQPIIALINSVQSGKNVGTAAGGLARPTALLYVPLVVNYVDGWRTGVQVQNRAPERTRDRNVRQSVRGNRPSDRGRDSGLGCADV